VLAGVQGLDTLGQLILGSQRSCAQQYQCSCEELYTLVELATEAGAKGGRLTGAESRLIVLCCDCQCLPKEANLLKGQRRAKPLLLGKLGFKSACLFLLGAGAGWGGCVVSLVEEQVVQKVLDALSVGYYDQFPGRKRLQSGAHSQIVVKPSGGASVWRT
jgi:galactokinase